MNSRRPSIAVVTGAAGGLGRAVVTELQARGHYLVGVDLEDAPLADASVHGDVSLRAHWERIAQTVRSIGLPMSTLVNCAGISTRTTLCSTSDEQWSAVIGVNLTGTWLGMSVCFPLLAERGEGAIINTGSIYGALPPPGPPNAPSSPAYQASKAGVKALTLTAASEFASAGVRVNCVVPGLFRTRLTDRLSEEEYRLRMRPVALGRDGRPEEFAAAVGFLSSPEASYITGSVLTVDGGYPLSL